MYICNEELYVKMYYYIKWWRVGSIGFSFKPELRPKLYNIILLRLQFPSTKLSVNWHTKQQFLLKCSWNCAFSAQLLFSAATSVLNVVNHSTTPSSSPLRLRRNFRKDFVIFGEFYKGFFCSNCAGSEFSTMLAFFPEFYCSEKLCTTHFLKNDLTDKSLIVSSKQSPY